MTSAAQPSLLARHCQIERQIEAGQATLQQSSDVATSVDSRSSYGGFTESRLKRDILQALFYSYARHDSALTSPYLTPADLSDLLRAVGERPSQAQLKKLIRAPPLFTHKQLLLASLWNFWTPPLFIHKQLFLTTRRHLSSPTNNLYSLHLGDLRALPLFIHKQLVLASPLRLPGASSIHPQAGCTRITLVTHGATSLCPQATCTCITLATSGRLLS